MLLEFNKGCETYQTAIVVCCWYLNITPQVAKRPRGRRPACNRVVHGMAVQGSLARACFACGRPQDVTSEPTGRWKHVSSGPYWASLLDWAHSVMEDSRVHDRSVLLTACTTCTTCSWCPGRSGWKGRQDRWRSARHLLLGVTQRWLRRSVCLSWGADTADGLHLPYMYSSTAVYENYC